MRQLPIPQEIYRHFKGNCYQILSIATHSETDEQMVVYQQLYAPFGVYVRPLDMFMSEVDHEKYPQVQQKYRFERIQAPAYSLEGSVASVSKEAIPVVPEVNNSVEKEAVQEEIPQAAYEEDDVELDSDLLRFLEADTYEEKLDILSQVHVKITDAMLDTMAVSLDVEIKDGDIERRYEELKNCLLTMEHFECNRLR